MKELNEEMFASEEIENDEDEPVKGEYDVKFKIANGVSLEIGDPVSLTAENGQTVIRRNMYDVFGFVKHIDKSKNEAIINWGPQIVKTSNYDHKNRPYVGASVCMSDGKVYVGFYDDGQHKIGRVIKTPTASDPVLEYAYIPRV